MTWIDLMICLPLIYGIYKGFTKGLILELASFLALILALYGGVKLTDFVSKFLISKFHLETTFISIISFTCVFICILVSVFVLAKILEGFIKIAMLSLFNKILGAVFGLLKYVIILIFIIYFIDSFNTRFNFYSEQSIAKSKLFKPALRLSKAVVNIYSDNKNLLYQNSLEIGKAGKEEE